MNYISYDIESTGLDFYRHDFQVKSIAIAWRDKHDQMQSRCYLGPQEIRDVTQRLKGKKILVYNASFDVGVVQKHLGIDWDMDDVVDVMRLRQLRGTWEKHRGIGLKAVTGEFLPHYKNYEQPFLEYLATQHNVSLKKAHQYLGHLPEKMLRDYNEQDAIVTYLLFESFCEYFDGCQFNWQKDHVLYRTIVQNVINGFMTGIPINREGMQKFIEDTDKEVAEIDAKFNRVMGKEILAVREKLRQKKQATFKKKIVTELPEFNTGSKQHLEMLFCGEQGLDIGINTPTGRPSFKSAHMALWGDGGKILAKRGKRLIVKGQANSLIKFSTYDGKYHPQLKTCGTSSGRLAGAGGCNVQGISRKDKGLLQNMLAPEGYVIVERDACYQDNTTEVLTPSGWKRFSVLLPTDLVWGVDPVTLVGKWEKPSRIISYPYTGNMQHFQTVRGSLSVTHNHKMLWVGQVNHPTRPDKRNWRVVNTAEEGAPTSGAHLALCSSAEDVSNFSEQDIWIACALHADSWWNPKKKRHKIQVLKPRKIAKLRELFGREGIKAPQRDIHSGPTETWNVNFQSPLLTEKCLNVDLLGQNQADTFVEALGFWDGSVATNSSRTGRISWSSTKEEEVDKIQSWLVRHGYEARKAMPYAETDQRRACFTLSIRKLGVIRSAPKKQHVCPSGRTQQPQRSEEHVTDCLVGCVEVPSGFVLVRANGNQCFVSGNCSGEPRVMCAHFNDENYRFVNLDIPAGVCPVKMVEVEGKKCCLINGDPYLTTMSISGLFTQDFWDLYNEGGFVEKWLADPEDIKKRLAKGRKINKMATLSIGYGSGGKKLQESAKFQAQIDISLEDAKEAVTNFGKLFPQMKRYAMKCQKENERNGGFIDTSLGFRSWPRRAFASMNQRIQSSLSSVINLDIIAINELMPEALFVTVIHDATVWYVKGNDLEKFRAVGKEAEDRVNKVLGWSVRMEFGEAVGKNWAELK